MVSVEPLFDVGGQNYDVFPGDSLFIVLAHAKGDEVTQEAVVIVHNLDAVLERLVGGWD